mmetsp:Transcript_6776/g.9655  ORF Transcript_6776/g.9655 Transcript_6776/m.9655 type:complete len:158 (+) Transcript_6776:40-513(+)|eukprot:CAMPEP_0206492042 /NCGR_PEP_ID=MMETSP0324_2-20121206/45639_1 /ASSEMBLY_ACC=CAM_ASM_000836 /TAXON_ID=2866 /ORGANISM="Crypthecodinium cohnii, Strain Seligo" /LENGTH=157 /DNA_ID=CAMNT_0053973915 /DNA_START=107 /DNA_END=580 /DNA_ORIENTATION=+
MGNAAPCCNEKLNSDTEVKLGGPNDPAKVPACAVLNDSCQGVEASGRDPSKTLSAREDEMLGIWATDMGPYLISRDARNDLIFREEMSGQAVLVGKLHQNGVWFETEVINQADHNKVFGFLRLRLEGDVMRSCFKKSKGSPWDPEGMKAKRLCALTR